MNTPRRKGTGAESALVDWFHQQGHHEVDRHALHGARDLGDLHGVPGAVVSVKYVGKGKPMNLSGWLNDLEVMVRNVHERHPGYFPTGLLVVRRVGYPNPGDWYAVQRLSQWWARHTA